VFRYTQYMDLLSEGGQVGETAGTVTTLSQDRADANCLSE